jgi:hypothetical protein
VHPWLEPQAAVADAGPMAAEPEVVAEGVLGGQVDRHARLARSALYAPPHALRFITRGMDRRPPRPELVVTRAIHPCGAMAHHGRREILDVSPQP